MKGESKKPKAGRQPLRGAGQRRPRTEVQPAATDTAMERPVFSFAHADRAHQGAWSWCDPDDAQELIGFMCDMGELTWREVQGQTTGKHKKHHAQAFDTISAEGAQRLSALKLDEVFEDFFRFRLSGQKRLWGFREGATFHVLWWDANHAVCPTGKRHT